MAVLSSPLQFISSTPTATKLYTALLLLLSSLYFFLHWRQSTGPLPTPLPYLTVIPGLSFWFPWTFLSAGFVEISIIELIFSLIFMPASLRYLERLWGTTETIKFIVINIVVGNVISFVLSWIEFVAFGYAETFLYGMEYRGQMALQTAVLVAFTQIIPEHQIQLFGVFKIRVKRLPMLYVGFSNVMCILGFQAPFILIQFGWLSSWTYLRFYKRTPVDTPGGVETYGDRSETFAFVHWFPPFVHYPVGILSNVVYKLCVQIRLVRPFSGTAPDLESGYAPLPGGARAEAERRR
ncbi:DUF1751-domain-containing protein [Sistotremastrum suecicum HHB10207 ss-3]|uniref:DUF1751-domain-containing protein n=1 Tax=Sistotremastrum suecicum HHB10207 ss-3 TaxID=1314776 RepID=A0A166IHE3_9AGAM|nr:DUF1751-domain-containing protein [Sistotremastrum suecicum HHB10207 ss-3]